MGMFDTFYGRYTCEHCGKTVEFEEQTKDFKNCLLGFKLGDYVDLGDKNYFYNFTYECPECHAVTELSIGIRNGQYVGVFFAENARNMDPQELENIENGLQRRIEYDKMCVDNLEPFSPEEDLAKIEKISSERCNSFSDNCRAIVGHDYGAAVWIRPVIIEDGEKIMSSNVHEVGMEISVDSSFFNDVLLDGFMKFFDPELDVNKKRFTRAFSDGGRFLTGFEREILEQNFFTYESIKEIIKYFEDIASSNEAGKLETAEMIKVIELLKTMMKFFPEAKYISVMS